MSDPCNQAKSIFLAAIEEHAPEQWSGFLDQVCASDVRLRAEVEKLLRARSEMGTFHELPRPAALATVDAPVSGERPGSIIGPYKLIEQIGEGGMGTVYMAQQTEPVKRAVAVKIIKPGMDTRQVIARFEAERQALALMDHPNIAKVLDAGTTGGQPGGVSPGRPFFVMELVKGVSITRYCDLHRLTPRQRLELFIPVCQAVQHAHQKGIIHRDLKPSNILVAQYDGKPVPKVIDFGVAKAAGQPLTDKTLMTGFGSLIGTLEYMSPEQAEINQIDVDTRSDIYSLGVVLYELLTGSTPLDRKRLTQAAFTEMLRIIREEDPPKPSTRLSDSTDSLPSISAQRQMEPAKLTRCVRGELDWIVMKALEKDRSRRYETANALAMDVERYLADEPVRACPPSATYRLRKFARRNKALLATAGLILLFLVLLGIAAGWVVRDRAARDQQVARDRWARETALDAEANRAISEAQFLIRDGRWPEALAVIERTQAVLVTAGRQSEKVPHGLRELAKDLAMAQRLEDIRSLPREELTGANPAKMTGGERHKDDGTPPDPGDALNDEIASAYARAFHEYGVDVTILPVAEAAERIRERSIPLELARALDFWSRNRRRRSGADNRQPDWKRVLNVAKLADTDPWRNQFREAVERRDRNGLEALAAATNIRERDPSSLHLLGSELVELGATEQAEHFLRQAQRQYPSDPWLNDALGACLSPSDDTVRFFTAIVAVRPRSPYFTYRLGMVLKGRGSHPEAIAQFTKAIELDPGRAYYWSIRGRAYSDLRQWDKAIADYSKSIELIPHDAQRWEERAHAYAILAQWDKAAADFAEAVDLRPEVVHWWMERASYHLQAGDTARYRMTCKRMLELFGQTQDPIVAQQTALSCLLIPPAVTDEELILQLAEHGVAGAPDEQWCPITLGAALYRASRFEAAADLELIVKSWPEDPYGEPGVDGGPLLTWLILAMTHHRLGHTHDARRWLDKAILRMDRESAAKEIGRLRQQSHVWAMCLVLRKEAETLLSSAGTAEPSKTTAVPGRNAYMVFSLALARKGSSPEAVEEFTIAVELDPKLAAAWSNRGVAYNNMGKWDQAIADYSKAVELNPKDADAWHNRASAYAVLAQWDKAAADSVLAVERNPADAGWWMERASYQLQAGDTAAHRTTCTRMLQRFRETKDPVIAHWTALSCLLIPQAVNDEKLVLQLAEQGLSGATDNQWSMITLGAALYRAGQFEAAADLGLIEKTWSEDPYGEAGADGGPLFTWLVLAMTHHRLGHTEEARRWLDKAVLRMDRESAAKEIGPLRQQSQVWAMCLVLRREAQGLLSRAGTDQPTRTVAVPRHNPYMVFSLGRALARKGLSREAVAEFTIAVELDPKLAAAWSDRGVAYTNMGKWDQAIADYSKAVELNPKDADAWHNRASAHAVLAQWDKAAADSAKAVDLRPEVAQWWMERASYHLQAGDTALYRTTCKRMLELFGRTEDPILAHRAAVSCLLIPQAVDDEKLVLQLAERGVAGAPLDQWSLIILGAALYRAGQFEAAADLGLVVKTWPDDPYGQVGTGGPLLSWLVLAMTHHRLDHTEEARRWLDKAVQFMDKESAANVIGPLRQQGHVWAMCLVLRNEAQELLSRAGAAEPSRTAAIPGRNAHMAFASGLALARTRGDQEAVAAFTKAVELYPKNTYMWFVLAGHLQHAGQQEDAVRAYNHVVQLDPQFAVAWSNRGLAYLNMGKSDQAITDYSKAIELTPKDALAWSGRAHAYRTLGKLEQAIADYSKAIELNPKAASWWLRRGIVHGDLGHWDQAIADYSKAIELDPNDATAHNRAAWALATHPNPQLRDPGRAVNWAKKAVELAPKNGNYRNTLGVALYRSGDWKAARIALEKSMELSEGGNSFDWFSLAMVHEKLGDREEARQWYNRATGWMAKNQATSEELRRFRAETAQVLGVDTNKD
jgi:tetratricopeptide (TPR) repeat protein